MYSSCGPTPRSPRPKRPRCDPVIELRQYPSLPHAWSAAAYLRAHGLLARGYQRETGRVRLGHFAGPPVRQDAFVAVAFEPDRAPGEELLDEFDQLPMPDESEWSASAEPDLSRLPPAMTIPCLQCAHDLRQRAGVRIAPGLAIECPRCGHANEPVEAVVARHGPEALLPCYPKPADPDWIDDATLTKLRIPCQKCRYPLTGLAPAGRCPECGQTYDKRATIEASFMGATP